MEKVTLPIKLPAGVRILVKVGTRVRAGDVIAETAKAREEAVDVSLRLGVGKKKLKDVVKVAIGQEVEKGSVLAVKSGVFGKKTVLAPMPGVVSEISEEKGAIVISEVVLPQEKVRSLVSGEVSGVVSDSVSFDLSARIWEGELGLGEDASGILVKIGEWGTSKLDELTVEAEGKVALTADVVSSAWLAKAAALGVCGVVCAGVVDGSLAKDISLGVVVMPSDDGQIKKKIWEELSRLSGKFVLIIPDQKKLAVVE